MFCLNVVALSTKRDTFCFMGCNWSCRRELVERSASIDTSHPDEPELMSGNQGVVYSVF